MKKTLVIAAMLFAIQFTQAQTGRGNLLINGNVGYTQSKNKTESYYWPTPTNEDKNMTVNGNVKLGYFFTKNFAAGVLIGDNYSKSFSSKLNTDASQVTTTENTTQTNIVSVGVFARGYKLFHGDKFGFIGEFYGTYGRGVSNYSSRVIGPTATTTSDNPTANINAINVGIRPGFTYFLNNKIGLEVFVGNLSFSSSKQESAAFTTTNNGLNFNVNASTISLGVSFYPGGK